MLRVGVGKVTACSGLENTGLEERHRVIGEVHGPHFVQQLADRVFQTVEKTFSYQYLRD